MLANQIRPTTLSAAIVFRYIRFWPKKHRVLPFLAIAQYQMSEGYGKHDPSPISIFCFLHPKISTVTNMKLMRLNVCVNNMALFGPYVLKGKTDEIEDPPGMAVLPIDRHGFAEGFASFRTLCSVQSSLVRFAPNRAIAWGPLQWQAP